MKVMLDTDICIALIRRKPPQALRRFAAHQVGDIGISWITFAELEFGVAASRRRFVDGGLELRGGYVAR